MSRQHLFRWLPLFLILALLGPTSEVDATGPITVTTTVDEVADNGVCSLREAVLSANSDTAVGGCVSGHGPDTIVFDNPYPDWPAEFKLTLAGADEDSARTGDLDVAGELTITGRGQFVTYLDGNSTDRILDILPGAHLVISDVYLTSGQAGVGQGAGALVRPSAALIVRSSYVVGNVGQGIVARGDLQVHDCTIAMNRGDGILVDQGVATVTSVSFLQNDGYALRNVKGGSLTVMDSEIAYNYGGIINVDSRATLTNDTIRENNHAAGVTNLGTLPSVLQMSRCTVEDHDLVEPQNGGGVVNIGVFAEADIASTTFRNNRVGGTGGAIYNTGSMALHESLLANNTAESGGGIDNAGGDLTVTNVTFSANKANAGGAALYNRADATIKYATIAGGASVDFSTTAALFNDRGRMILGGSVIGANAGAAGCANREASVLSSGYNVEQDDTCDLRGQGDVTNADPLLAPLAENGGAMQTHALLPGGPAIDRVPVAECVAIDQRGYHRPAGSGCDSGAYEFGALAPRIWLPQIIRG